MRSTRRSAPPAKGRPCVRWRSSFFDIADFGAFNRSFGYGAGDKLLAHLGGLLKEAVGEARACRADADHFYALVDDARAEGLIDAVHAKMKDDPTYATNVTGGIYTIERDRNEHGSSARPGEDRRWAVPGTS